MAENLTVLIIGNGAREHAISQAYENSADVKRIIVASGNDFITYNREKEVIIDKNCNLKQLESILWVAKKHKPDLVDVAQDDVLALGTVDLLQENGFLVFGPNRNAARIEWDKKWSKELMIRNNIPTADFRPFNLREKENAVDYVKSVYRENPNKLLYVKATGLCSGKGALKSANLEEAIVNIEKMKYFGDAGKTFLIEDGLEGEELSYFVATDGFSMRFFKSAQDNKTAFNFDRGDQTGGMGAISPTLLTQNKSIENDVRADLIGHAIDGLRFENLTYKGILYVGGIVVDGKPFVIEYNARWGDPECQVVLPSLESDYLETVLACLEKKLWSFDIQQDNKTRVCVVGVSRGYPDPKEYSDVISKRIYGLEDAMKIGGIKIFGAGIKIEDGKFYANGGRLFSIVAEGDNIIEARQKAYSAIAYTYIEGNNLHYRTDIGWRDVERFYSKNLKI